MVSKMTGSKIARLAKVSQSTVSRALDPDHAWMISRDKREKIRSLCKKYGVTSLSVEQQKKSAKTFRVAWICGTLERDIAFYGSNILIRRMCDILQENGYYLELIRIDYSPDKLSSRMRKILRSDAADFYIVGGTLLGGQALDFLHKYSNRLLLLLNPEQQNQKLYPQFPWLSFFIKNDQDALCAALQSVPESFRSSMIYFGYEGNSSQNKLHCLAAAAKSAEVDISSLKTLFLEPHAEFLPADSYRLSRQEILAHLDELAQYKCFWCGGYSGYVLYDELVRLGKKPGRDFYMIMEGQVSKLISPLQTDISYICKNIDQQAQLLCDTILELLHDPTPQKVVFKTFFTPAKFTNQI